jgi:2'-5' RNA ligase
VTERVTLGVSIAVPEPHATVLTNWRRRSGDPQAEHVWPHVTLLPPTPIAVSELAVVETHLREAGAQVSPFPMHLFGTGTFRPVSPVVFIQVARGLADCELLEKAIRSGPLERDLDFPYHPHVTVAQEIGAAALDEAYEGLADYVARFAVEHFVLFTRDGDGRWTWRSEFPLGGAAGPAAG